MGRSLDARAEKPLKVLCLPARNILFVNRGLILNKQLELGLRNRVALKVDLKLVRWFQRTFSYGIDGTLDIAVLCRMYRSLKVKVTLPMPFFPGSCCETRTVPVIEQRQEARHLLSRLRAEPSRLAHIFWAQDEFVPAIDGFALVTTGLVGVRLQPHRVMRTA
jgi:hypothetical protein